MNPEILPANNIIFTLDLSEKYLNMTFYENNATDPNNITSIPVNIDIEVDGKEFISTISETIGIFNDTFHITNETIDDFFTDLTEFKKNLEELAEYKEKFLIEESEVNREHLDDIEVYEEEVIDHSDGDQTDGEHAEDEHLDSEQTHEEHFEGEHFDGEHSEGEHVEEEHSEGEHFDGEHVEEEHSEGEHFDGEHVEEEHTEGEHIEEHFDGEHHEEYNEEEYSEEEHDEESHDEEGEHHIEEHFEGDHDIEEHHYSDFTKLEYHSQINTNHPDFPSFDEEVSRLLNEKYNHLYDDIYLINQNQDPINYTNQKVVDNSTTYKEPPIYPFIILIVFIILYLIGYRRMELLRNRVITV